MMENSTVPMGFGGPEICATIECPDDKLCFKDEDEDLGYKCCRNKKCVAKCEDPGLNLNSKRIPDLRDSKFKPKERIFYSCEKGYYLSSSGHLTCKDDGTWSHSTPSCTRFGLPSKPHVTSPKLEFTSTMTPAPPTSVPKLAFTSTTTPAPSTSVGVVAIALLLPILLLVIAAAVLYFRYKNRTHRHISIRCRKRSHPVMFENTHPKMPENLDDGAVLIRDFAQYVAVRHNNADRLFREEFEEIQKHTAAGLSYETSELEENQDKNRYTNIVAYDHTRVHLNRGKKHRRSSSMRSYDYINANFISSYERPDAYIACQGPLPETFGDFWKMIWENNVSVIVMITNLVENGRRKCDQYWPQDGREQYKHLSVFLRDVDVYANYTVRTFQLRDTKQSKRRSYNNERRVVQFHYTQWPDHGTPEYILPLLTFIRRSSQANTTDTSPIVVHCSAGVGRSGAYIMLHSMIQMALKTGKININKFLRFIRTQRNHLVQTEDQYTFLHDALLCHFACGNTEFPAQQLNSYVQSLLAKPLPPRRPEENGTQSSESLDPRLETPLIEVCTGMERQFMIVARHVVRDIDYDFARREVNQSKNRADAILPVFRSRVPLHYRVGSEGSDYINASFLQGYRNGRMFIVTQLPMANTRNDFWSLVWDHNCSVFITIRDEAWDEKNDEFWLMGEENQISCPLFNVCAGTKSIETRQFGGIVVITRSFVLEATKDDYVLAVSQIDISGWPTINELSLEFTQLLEFIVRHTENKDGSVIVQDRFGGKAAGQLACSHSLHQQLANENAVDVFQTVRLAYQMRPEIFKSQNDLHFLYKAMLLQTNPSHYRKPDLNDEKTANFASRAQITETCEKAPLLCAGDLSDDTRSDHAAGDSATTETSLLLNEKSDSDCDVKKGSGSHYDLINEVTTALQTGDEVKEERQLEDSVSEKTFETLQCVDVPSEFDDSALSTAKLLK